MFVTGEEKKKDDFSEWSCVSKLACQIGCLLQLAQCLRGLMC